MSRHTRSALARFAFGSLLVAAACTGGAGPKGHITYVKCVDGGVVSAHAPLNANIDGEDFKDCGDGRCVALGGTCPDPKPEPVPEPKPEPKPDGACEVDSECAWDDDCMPTKCVPSSGDPVPTNCDETAPPPGECKCVESECTVVAVVRVG